GLSPGSDYPTGGGLEPLSAIPAGHGESSDMGKSLREGYGDGAVHDLRYLSGHRDGQIGQFVAMDCQCVYRTRVVAAFESDSVKKEYILEHSDFFQSGCFQSAAYLLC